MTPIRILIADDHPVFRFGLRALLYNTRLGVAMRATALDQEAALAQGISARRVFAVSWGIAGFVAAMAGVTLGAGSTNLSLGVGFIALAAFPAMILGGLDSPIGAVVGGLVIGLTQVLTAGYQPDYFAWAVKLSRAGTVIIVDNVVRGGKVADAFIKSFEITK